MTCGIYSITSPSGNCYIGSSKDVKSRWARHKWELRKGSHHAIKLQRAYNKYGLEALTFNVLEECSIGNLEALEQLYLTAKLPRYNSALQVNTINTAAARAKVLNTIRTKAHRQKISQQAKELKTSLRLHTPEAKDKNRFWRRQDHIREMYKQKAIERNQIAVMHTPEARAKQAATRRSPEARSKATEQCRSVMRPVKMQGSDQVFESVSAAGRATNIPAGNIRRAATNGCKAGGFNWVFAEVI